MPASSSSRAPTIARAVGGACKRGAGRHPANPDGAELGDGRPAGQGEHVDRYADRLDDGADLPEIGEAGGVDDIGTCVAVGDQAGDGVVQIGGAVEVALGRGR